MISPDRKNSWEPIFFDIFVLSTSILYFTGGHFLFTDQLQLLVNQKPWIHRAFLSLLAVAAIAWFFIREERVKSGKVGCGFVVTLFTYLKLSEKKMVLLLFFLTAFLWGASSSLRHESFQTSFDMAIFTQAIWNTAQGDWFYSSIKGGVNLMSDHFSPILALLAIPYRIFPTPHLILWIQAIAAASAVIPLYAIAKSKLSDPRLIFAILIGYFFYLPVRNAVRFDFHPEVLAIPLFLWAFHFLEARRFLISSLYLMLAVSTKEAGSVIAAAFGFYALIKLKKPAYGLFWLFFGTIYFALITQWVIPHLFKTDYFYLSSNYLSWKDRGGFPAVAQHLLNFSTISYLIKIFAPLCFFSLFDISALLTLPALAQNLLARNEMARSIFFQYTAYLTPFVFISTIYGASRIKKMKVAAIALIITSVGMGGVSELYVAQVAASKRHPDHKRIKAYMASLPASETVRTHEFFASHLANRKHLHIYENNHPKEGGSLAALNSTYLVVDRRLLGDNHASALESIRKSGYSSLVDDHGFYVFKK